MKKSLLEIINEVLSKSNNTIESISSEMDLGMDSMNLAFLTVLIEDEYGIDVFENGMVSKISDIEKKING